MILERISLRTYVPLRLVCSAILLQFASLEAPAANPAPPALASTGRLQTPALTGTAPGRRLAALISAFNRGDPVALQVLVADSFEPGETGGASPAGRTEELHRLFKMTGGLALRRVERSRATEIRVLAQARVTGAWYRLMLFTTAKPPQFAEPVAPNKIVGFGYETTTAPAEVAEIRFSDSRVSERLDRLMDFLVRGGRFAGVVQVQRGDKVVYARAFGEADRLSHIPNGLQTRFNLASITKMFTAVSIGQLIQAGQLKLSDPVGKVLPELADSDIGRLVTVQQLLSHTSGMVGARAAIEKGLEPARTSRSIPDMMASFIHAPLAFRPGQQFEYSNAGYILLGAVIERVSGETYHNYVQRHVFDAAGMHNSGFYTPGEDQRLATGYKDGAAGALVPNTGDLPLIGSPANMAFSTAGDMTRFANALFRGQLLRKDLIDLFWTGVTEQPNEIEYGYGARIEHYNGRRFVWHGGGAPGVTNRFEMVPLEELTVVVLSNYDTEPEIIVNKLREWLSPRRTKPAPTHAPPDLTLSVRTVDSPPTSSAGMAFDLLVSNRGGTAHAAVVNFEIKDQSGAKVEQQFVADQRLGAAESRQFRFVCTARGKGPLQISAGVFGPGWGSKFVFVDGLATVDMP